MKDNISKNNIEDYYVFDRSGNNLPVMKTNKLENIDANE